jgi:5-methylcytosine-specific restriction endonuclease McrA
MIEILNQNRVLVLNAAWRVIGTKSVADALTDVAKGAYSALDIQDDYMNPLNWEDWVKVPVRQDDDVIHTTKLSIRVPRVIIAKGYKKVLVKKLKCNMRNVRRVHNDTCAITKRKLKPSEMSLEHVVPVSKGGKTAWENVVLADKDINSRRGNMPYASLGYDTPTIPPAPREKPASEMIENKYGFPEWEVLLGRK